MNGDQLRAAVCPVCRARFRGMTTCSRCGADLTLLTLLAARAYRLRQQARQALRVGDGASALACVEQAQSLRATLEGSLLRWICTVASGEGV
jgi:hypothetical protein